MNTPAFNLLGLAGVLTLFVAALHVACIAFGADWYRAMGAGEQMARLAEQGDPYPTIVTSVITCVFLMWSAYAFSGAGLIIKLPLLKLVLCLITLVLLARALGFYFLMPAFPDNSLKFWIISSGACLVLGATYALGIRQAWESLSRTAS